MRMVAQVAHNLSTEFEHRIRAQNLSTEFEHRIWVYGCMNVYGPLEARKVFSYISNQKNGHFGVFFLYKNRQVYGHLNPRK